MNKKGIAGIVLGTVGLGFGIFNLIKGGKVADDVELDGAETCEATEETDCEEEESDE
jgi:hypothetical protein